MTHKQIWTDDPTERYDTKSREVWIDLEDHDRLLIGLRVDVSIDFNSSVTPEGGKNPQTLPTTAAAPVTHPSQSVNQANRTPPRVTSSTTGEQPSTPAFTPQTPPAPAQPFQPYRATAHPPLPPTPSQREAD